MGASDGSFNWPPEVQATFTHILNKPLIIASLFKVTKLYTSQIKIFKKVRKLLSVHNRDGMW